MDVSIIIPAHNSSKTISLTLDKVLQMSTTLSYEVWVIENKSTDDTYTIVNEFTIKDPRINLIRSDKPGAAAARNLGGSKAKGKILIFWDHDILPDPHALDAHYQFIRQRAGQKVVSIGRIEPLVLERSNFIDYLSSSNAHVHRHEILMKNQQKLHFGTFYTGNFAIARSVFEMSGGFDETFQAYGVEDIEYGYRFSKQGGKIIYNPDAFVYHAYFEKFEVFCDKKRMSGRSLAIFAKRAPEISNQLPTLRIYRRTKYLLAVFANPITLRILKYSLFLAERSGMTTISSKLYYLIIYYFYYLGLRQGFSEHA